MSKNWTIIACAGILLAGSLGWTAGTAPALKPAETALAKKKIKIGVSVPAADHGWTAGIGYWAKKAMDMYPDVDWVYATANGPDKQIADIQNMQTRGIDALVILATESAPLTPTAKRLKKDGVFIVNVDRGFLEPCADVFLEGDNKAFGRRSATFVADKMRAEKRTNLVILSGIPCTVDTDRVSAAKDVFARYPEIKILDTQPANWDRSKALAVMQNLLVKHPKIDAVWVQDDDMLMGAMQAIKEAKREKEMWVVGGAGMKEVVKMVMDKDPMVPADITYPPSMIAAGIHTAVSILRDGKEKEVMQFMPRHLMMDVELITPENAKEFYFPDSVY